MLKGAPTAGHRAARDAPQPAAAAQHGARGGGGAVILPAMPGFYHLPRTIDDLADFLAGKILSMLGFEHQLYPRWKDGA